MNEYKDCPRKGCANYKPNEKWLSFCEKECAREFYYDPNGGGMTKPEHIKDEFNLTKPKGEEVG